LIININYIFGDGKFPEDEKQSAYYWYCLSEFWKKK